MPTKKSQILTCFETNSSGEALATQSIIQELKNSPKIELQIYAKDSLKKTSFFFFFGWLIKNLIGWFSIIILSKPQDWVYTTTFTAGRSEEHTSELQSQR